MKKAFLRINRDVNRENLYQAGQQARDREEPLSSCPSLLRYIPNSNRATFLMSEWCRGWESRNTELRSPRHAMKGAD